MDSIKLSYDTILSIYLHGIWIMFLGLYLWNVYQEFTIYKKTLNTNTFKSHTSFKYYRTEVLEWTGFWVTIFWPLTLPICIIGVIIEDKADTSMVAYLLIKWDKYKNPEKYI